MGNCTDTSRGGFAACDVAVPGVDTVRMEVHMQPCAEPAVMDLTIDEEMQGFHKHIGGTASVDETFVLDKLTVKVKKIGNATASAKVKLESNAQHITASVALDACGYIRNRHGCASEVPRSPFPLKVLDVDRDMGQFCEQELIV